MPKDYCFSVGLQEFYDLPVVFGRSNQKLLGLRLTIDWQSENYELSREFWHLLDILKDRVSVEYLLDSREMPEAKDFSEKFSRGFSGLPICAYTHTESYLVVSLGKTAKYKLQLNYTHSHHKAGGMTDLINTKYTLVVNSHSLKVEGECELEGKRWIAGITSVEVLSSPARYCLERNARRRDA